MEDERGEPHALWEQEDRAMSGPGIAGAKALGWGRAWQI